MVASGESKDKSVFVEDPVLIVEVLSPSTMATDRREKLQAYRKLASLKEYLIDSQNSQKAEMHRRNDSGTWDVFEFGRSDEILFESVPAANLQIAMSQVYADIDFGASGMEVREESEDYW